MDLRKSFIDGKDIYHVLTIIYLIGELELDLLICGILNEVGVSE